MDNALTIRIATVADAAELLALYTPYVEQTAITFELELPTLDDFAGRVRNTLGGYPYLVAERNGEIVGYAYASAFRPRAAYRHTAESSIYVHCDRKGGGIGRALYEALGRVLLLQNVYNLEACIASAADPEDEYVPPTSKLFHERLGFTLAGTFKNCAYKFGRWYNMIWMERILADHPADPEPFVPFSQLDPDAVAAALRG